MSGSHMAQSAQKKSNSSWKIWVLVVALLIAVAALVFLLLQLFHIGPFGDGGSSATADIAPGIFTQIDAQYGNGRNAAGNIAVTQGTRQPDTIPAGTPDVVLLDFSWKDGGTQTEPVYLTVSDPSFTNGDGLAVHRYDEATAQWDTIGTFSIQNNAVTFQTDSLAPFAFQVVSSSPLPSATPEVVATPEPSPEPTPEPTPEVVPVMDYGDYPTVQTGVFTMAGDLEDGHTYVVALVENMDAADETAQTAETAEEPSGDGVSIDYVEAPDSTGAETPEADPNAPKATVLMNLNGSKLQAVEMPLLKAEDGTWYLGGPITEGMLWKATRDAYKDDYRYSLGNHDRYLNIDDSEQNMVLDDNDVRTRWLVQSADLADGTQIDTLNYRDGDRFYVTALEMTYVALTDQAFPAGDAGASVSAPTYLGTEAPVDQTLVDQTLRFTVSKEQSEAKQVVIFELNEGMTVPADVKTILSHRVTVPVIDGNTDLSMLDIRDGDRVLQLGTDYTVAARVYNNSTTVVVISFLGEYSGQIVRTYSGTTFRTDGSQPTAPPAATATPEPTQAPAGGTGTGTGTGTGSGTGSGTGTGGNGEGTGGSGSGTGSSGGGSGSSPTDANPSDESVSPTDA